MVNTIVVFRARPTWSLLRPLAHLADPTSTLHAAAWYQHPASSGPGPYLPGRDQALPARGSRPRGMDRGTDRDAAAQPRSEEKKRRRRTRREKAAAGPARRPLGRLAGSFSTFSRRAAPARKHAARKPRAAENSQRRYDRRRTRRPLRDSSSRFSLDDVDTGVGDHAHVHRKDLEGRTGDDRGPLLEGERVVADHARAVPDQEVRAVEARSG